jgi:MGT family glycosyltransferase
MTRTPTRTVAFFLMEGEGHFRRLLPIITAVARRGLAVHVFTHRGFADAIAHAGGTFVDLFAEHTPDDADDESLPRAIRGVTFAGLYGDEIVATVAALRPALVVYDTFAVIGRVVASALGVRSVNVCAGHNVDPAGMPRLLAGIPVRVAERCQRAVEILRDRFGIADASPFSYAASRSPFLNVYCEPAEWLTESERQAYEPVAFFGSLPPIEELARPASGEPFFGDVGAALRVYVSFGTIVWRYFATQAIAALGVIAETLAAGPDTRTLISLGRHDVDPSTIRTLARPNVAVRDYVDQWQVLRQADVFVTHHGLSSTHEAIFHGVPMISYPFFWDQPALAAKCRELGIAIPLGDSVRAPLCPADVSAALTQLRDLGDTLRSRLAIAREWEMSTVDSRDAVIDRIVALSE